MARILISKQFWYNIKTHSFLSSYSRICFRCFFLGGAAIGGEIFPSTQELFHRLNSGPSDQLRSSLYQGKGDDRKLVRQTGTTSATENHRFRSWRKHLCALSADSGVSYWCKVRKSCFPCKDIRLFFIKKNLSIFSLFISTVLSSSFEFLFVFCIYDLVNLLLEPIHFAKSYWVLIEVQYILV